MLMPGAGIMFFINFLMTGTPNPDNFMRLEAWYCWIYIIIEVGGILFFSIKTLIDSFREEKFHEHKR